MSNSEETYAPKSPDLSSLYSQPMPSSTVHIPDPSPHSCTYSYSDMPHYPSQPQPYTYTSTPPVTSYPSCHNQQNLPPSPQQQQQHPRAYISTYQGQSYSPPVRSDSDPKSALSQATPTSYYRSQSQKWPNHTPRTPITRGSAKPSSHATPPQLQHTPKKEPPEQPELSIMPPRRSASSPSAAASDSASLATASPVKTKFPTARIKRIMQADEEVGKVAQQTPIAVGKALELFMVQLVTRSADIARERVSKRITATMLKQVIEQDDQWDFLREIVDKVTESEDKDKDKALGPGRRPKVESETDDDEAMPRKGRAGRKRKAPGG